MPALTDSLEDEKPINNPMRAQHCERIVAPARELGQRDYVTAPISLKRHSATMSQSKNNNNSGGECTN